MGTKTQTTVEASQIQFSVSQMQTVYPILFAIAFAHFINDSLQIIIQSIYPILQQNYLLTFTQVGVITFVYQMTASMLQPVVGHFTDKNPQPFSQVYGMGFTMLGLILLAFAWNYWIILLAVALVGIGSSIFHPESSRVAFLASGGKRGFAQAVFQVGGNAGTAIGPLLVILIVVPHGQSYILWFLISGVLGIAALARIGKWYKKHLELRKEKKIVIEEKAPDLSKKEINFSIGILLALIFSKYIYLTSITSYFTFYVIDKFGASIRDSQFYLFLFLGAVALGTYLGGPVGDRYGRKYVIWFSILGSAPFTLLLPYVNLLWTGILVVIIGIILSSAFSAILVYAQELLPGRVGMISGLFFGFAFGIAGVGSAVLGYVADHTSIEFVYKICAYLPLMGLITYFLPDVRSGYSGTVKKV